MTERKEIYSVSSLTREIKGVLENRFPYVWIYGEISNLRIPSSGHCYFTLKDQGAQISGVLFRGQASRLKFRLQDGQTITGLGRVSLYEPRGTYQIIFEYMEPKGAGALQLAFEQLKRKLAAEGLFDEAIKKKRPPFPERIALVTSPTGAVVHDMLTVFRLRYPNAELLVVPVRVQGDQACLDIPAAIAGINRHMAADLIIVARGGGSLEDLAPFNSEEVARAIHGSVLPVISAVGHETDYTIADFTADMRAPTPTAAASLAVPDKKRLKEDVALLAARLRLCMDRRIEDGRLRLNAASRRLVDPKKKIYDHRLRVDELTQRMARAIRRELGDRRTALTWRRDRLAKASPLLAVEAGRREVRSLSRRLNLAMEARLARSRDTQKRLEQNLSALSPKLVLDRGYSIVRDSQSGEVITRAAQVEIGSSLDVVLADGLLEAVVERKDDGKEKI
ncbi:exodeoxyribonuclease VII large subunit [Desulfoluna butyratoxydans]|uniref:Exodeoxyribonuclease 7 large subunit n=1 Tax=Desulfoluna butyratoxydans TaxID=231438 RepID=A0A4U8YQV7_9BACT|nr:exodeoxyribonuclease VII large subunit [Desulfoluna butyratoxydans]VFQ46705.1 exonuclease vii large subunit [Desulfoluna butyratoxydans]